MRGDERRGEYMTRQERRGDGSRRGQRTRQGRRGDERRVGDQIGEEMRVDVTTINRLYTKNNCYINTRNKKIDNMNGYQ